MNARNKLLLLLLVLFVIVRVVFLVQQFMLSIKLIGARMFPKLHDKAVIRFVKK